MRDHITYLTYTSEVLDGNPLGDPITRQFPVYTPPAEGPHPVVWLLAPFGSWGERYLNLKAWNENIIERAHRLITKGEMPPCIFVLPDCFTSLGGSQYLNSAAIGRYENYLMQELIPFVDSQLPTLAQRQHRGVMGYSSGGYAALRLGMLYPEVFGALASHAGDMGFAAAFQPDFGKAVQQLEKYDSLDAFMQAIGGPDMGDKNFFPTLNLVAMSACYSPTEDGGIDLPFDTYTGELKPEVWQRWLEKDPVEMAHTHAHALADMALVYFDCGIFDEYNLFLGSRRLHKLLDEQNIAHTYEEFKGGHRNINWRYDTSLPLIAEAIAP